MKYNPEIHHRRSIRLKEYDYTQTGAYFITICSVQRKHIFGDVIDGEVKLSSWGEIAKREWFKTADLRTYVKLHEDEFVVMPNHIHGIIWINNAGELTNPSVREKFGKPVSGSIPTIVRAYKSAVTYSINQNLDGGKKTVWQANYYEHVIRNDRELELIARYIMYNPHNWQEDRDNLMNSSRQPFASSSIDYVREAEYISGWRKS